jgi:hypothetical protein
MNSGLGYTLLAGVSLIGIVTILFSRDPGSQDLRASSYASESKMESSWQVESVSEAEFTGNVPVRPDGWLEGSANPKRERHLPPAAPSFTIQVVDAISNKPLKDCEFKFNSGRGKQSGVTDSDGTQRINALPAAAQRVLLKPKEATCWILGVLATSDDLNTLKVTVAPGASVKGVVTDWDGNPLPGISIWAYPLEIPGNPIDGVPEPYLASNSGHDGSFSIPEIQGWLRLVPHFDSMIACKELSGYFAPYDQIEGCELKLDERREVEIRAACVNPNVPVQLSFGRLMQLGALGSPPKCSTSRVSHEGFSVALNLDDPSRFMFSGGLPAGEVQFKVVTSDGLSVFGELDSNPGFHVIEIPAPMDASGYVVDGDGTGVEGATVWVWSNGKAHLASTDSRGEFQFKDVVLGRQVVLLAAKPGFQVAFKTYSVSENPQYAGSLDLNLRMQKGALRVKANCEGMGKRQGLNLSVSRIYLAVESATTRHAILMGLHALKWGESSSMQSLECIVPSLPFSAEVTASLPGYQEVTVSVSASQQTALVFNFENHERKSAQLALQVFSSDGKQPQHFRLICSTDVGAGIRESWEYSFAPGSPRFVSLEPGLYKFQVLEPGKEEEQHSQEVRLGQHKLQLVANSKGTK